MSEAEPSGMRGKARAGRGTAGGGDLSRRDYWIANIRYVTILLLIWFAVSYGCGILLAPWLNQFRFPGSGFKVGFWFAQQGSIYVFIALIVVYVKLMARLDAHFGVGEDDGRSESGGGAPVNGEPSRGEEGGRP